MNKDIENTAMRMNRTPIPYNLALGLPTAITGNDKIFVADCSSRDGCRRHTDEANATFIVLACNSFDRDQETIKKLTDALKQIHFDTEDPFADERSIDELHKQLLGVCNQAALALAETT